MLHTEQLEAGHGQSTVIRNVSLTVKPGQVVALMGRNGVGKTTLLKTIIGLLKATNGTVTYEGQPLTSKNPTYRARAGIGYVPQGREIFPELSVRENLLLSAEASAGRSQSINEQVFTYFPVLKEMANRKGGDLSGGQQQQLSLGRALTTGASLLLLDEPTEGIQPNIVADIQHVIRSLKEAGKHAILLVEQSFDFAQSVADYTYVMDQGKIVYHGAKPTESELSSFLSI